MIVSIVSGTFNRLASLIRMIESARASIPSGMTYEFVIVDGGSTDGTLQWLRLQRDVKLIEHGELRGAIRAFCEGAEAATGDFVLLANDDVSFIDNTSILRAITYLEQNPQCGAVAFMDDRLYTDPTDPVRYKAQTQRALDAAGKPTSVIYAQVGLFRRELGNLAGWWGAHHPIMNQAKTYGGDNHLSSQIWEFGYTVDIVPGVICADYRINDDLRKINDRANDSAYWKAFPDGPRLGSRSKIGNQIIIPAEHLRILYLPVFEPGHTTHKETKRGLYNALAKRGLVWEWDYLNERAELAQISAFSPHLILTQFHDSHRGNLILELRRRIPDAIFVNWNGDARALTDPAYIEMLLAVDLQLVVNAAALPAYQAAGIPAAYWQIGYEEALNPLQDVPAHDVIFLGNSYNAERQALGAVLRSLKCDVGIYGFGWRDADGSTLYDFNAGAGLYQKSKIAIADTFHDGKTEAQAFISNRTFQAMAVGAFVLQQRSPRLEEFTGLKANEHYAEWQTLEELPDKIAYYLKNTKERNRIAKVGHAFVLANYSFDRQVEKLFKDLLPMIERDYESA